MHNIEIAHQLASKSDLHELFDIMKIYLDTNFLIYAAEHKLDYKELIRDLIPGKIEIQTIEPVIKELNLIKSSARKASDKNAALMALKLLEKNKIKSITSKINEADEALIELSDKEDAIIATMDKGLRTQLKKVILINQGKKLILSK